MIEQLTLFNHDRSKQPILNCLYGLVRGKERQRKYKQRGKKNGK